MADNKNWNEAVKRLLAHTKANLINWEAGHFPSSSRENVIGEIYSATILDRIVVVYESKFRSYTDEDNWSWEEVVVIEFVDEEGRLQWQWPMSLYRVQLLDAIRAQVYQADTFLDEFMADRHDLFEDN